MENYINIYQINYLLVLLAAIMGLLPGEVYFELKLVLDPYSYNN